MYTLWAALAAVAVVALEVLVLHTGLLRSRPYWITLLIVLAFQVLVDGWLTKRSSPIVIYNRREMTGLRFPFSIPVEDFLYGFSLVTLVLALWVRGEREVPWDRDR